MIKSVTDKRGYVNVTKWVFFIIGVIYAWMEFIEIYDFFIYSYLQLFTLHIFAIFVSYLYIDVEDNPINKIT